MDDDSSEVLVQAWCNLDHGQQPPVVVHHPSIAPSHVLSSLSFVRVNLNLPIRAHSFTTRFWALQTPRLEIPRGGFSLLFLSLLPPQTIYPTVGSA